MDDIQDILGIKDSEVKFGVLKGEVRGFYKKEYTHGISPANVFVKVWLPGEKYKVVAQTLIKIPKGTYNPFDEDSLNSLKKDHPDAYHFFGKVADKFKLHPVDEFGQFELVVPLGRWGFIVSAYVEERVYHHTDSMGNDGSGKAEVITAERFKETDKIEGIIIPVEDKWWEPPAGAKKHDPKTDPKKILSGVMDDKQFEEIEKHRKEKMHLPVDDEEVKV